MKAFKILSFIFFCASMLSAFRPNPAYVYCVDNGGTIETRTDSCGGEDGVCMWSDGTECGQWAFFRGECKKGECNYWCVNSQKCIDPIIE